jgi:phosphate starvation-inducible membrane PsiE
MKRLSALSTAIVGNLVIASTAYAIDAPKIDNPVGKNTNFGDLLATVINALLVFAGAVAVLFLIVGGFRYVVSAGNPDQVEGAKKTILYAILGLIIIFIAFVLVQLIESQLNVNPDFQTQPK